MENESVCWNWMTDREKDAGEAAPSSLYTSGEDFIAHVSFFFSDIQGSFCNFVPKGLPTRHVLWVHAV